MGRLLALAVLLLAWLPWAALAQASDKDFLTRFLEDSLSSAGRQVEIQGFEGALSTRATMQSLTISDDLGTWLTLSDVTLDWSQSELLHGKIVIGELSAGLIQLERLPAAEDQGISPEAGRFVLPDLPVAIDIRKLEARRVVLGQPVLGQAVEGRITARMQLANGEGQVNLDLLRQDGGPEGHFTLDASYKRDGGILSLTLQAIEGKGGIAVSALGVPGLPAAELAIKGQGPAGGFDADVLLATDGVARLQGRVRGITTETGTGFEADLAGDPTPVFAPAYAAFFGPDVRLFARGQSRAGGGYDLSELTLRTATLSLQGRLVLDGDMAPELVALNGQIDSTDGATLLPLATSSETRIDRASLTLAYDRSQGDVWQGEALVTGLDHPGLRAKLLHLSGNGSFRIDGGERLLDGRLEYVGEDLDIDDPRWRAALGARLAGSARIAWQSGQDLAISDLGLSGQGFDLTTTGTLGDLASGLTIHGRVAGDIVDLSKWSGVVGLTLSGAAKLDLQGQATLWTGAADLSGQVTTERLGLGIAALDPLLAGTSQLTLSLRRDETGTELRQLALEVKGLSAGLSGHVSSDRLALTGGIAVPDMAGLHLGLSGSAKGEISVTGNLATQSIRLGATAQDLGTGLPILDPLFAGESQLTLDLSVSSSGLILRQGSLASAKARLTAEGPVTGITALSGTAELPRLSDLSMGLSGQLQADWRYDGALGGGSLAAAGKVRDLSLGLAAIDPLLAGETEFTARLSPGGQGMVLDELGIAAGGMSLSATGQLRADGQDLQIIHRITDLQSLVSGLPGSLESRGTLRRSADGVVLDLVTRGPGQIAAKVAGSLDPNLATGDVTIKGTASAAVANGFAAPRSLAGALAYDLRLKGPVGLASLTGTVTLSGGRMADPGQSFGLQDMAAQFVLSGGRIEGSGTTRVSSGGVVSARGTIGLAAPYAANLALSVTGVTLRDPDLYSTRLDGALTLTGPVLGGALLAGTLDLGRTEIRVPSSSLVADGGLPGLQHRGEPGDSRETRAHAGQGQEGAGFAASSGKRGYALDLRINAPAQVFVRGRGLDAELGGRLRLRGRTDAISPEGALGLVRGRLDILGKRLTLSEAQLQMQGRLVPYLRIVADVVSGDILATVEIEGPVDDPEVRFSSSPDLPQEEVVARLLFDRGLENLTAFQALKLASAVASLAGKGGEGLVGNVRRRAGVDNLDIQAGQDGATEVTVGKYLSEKAYTEVTVGDAGTSSISINLDLAPHITLKGRMDSTGESGVGVFLQRDY